jgi:WD40 repeat protein
VVIWDAGSGRERAALDGQTGITKKLAIAPDSKVLATNDGDTLVHLWDLSSGKKIATLSEPQGAVSSLAFLPDGKLAASWAEEPPILWDAASGRRLRKLDLGNRRIAHAAFSPDGQLLATVGTGVDASVRVWDTRTWTQRGSIPTRSRVDYLAFAPDGLSLMVHEQDWKVWDPFVFQERKILPLIPQTELYQRPPAISPPPPAWIAFSPDGRTLAVAQSGNSVTNGVTDPNVFLFRTDLTGKP